MTFKCAIVDMQCWTCCKCPECRLTDKRTDWQTLTLYKKHIFLWQPRPSKYLCMYIFHIVWPTLRLQILKLFVWPRLCCFRLLHWTSSCCLSSMTILLPLTHSLTHSLWLQRTTTTAKELLSFTLFDQNKYSICLLV